MTTGIRKTGDFCWINILTPDPAAARDFFTGLLGWEYTEMPGMGHLIKVGGHDVGGIFDLHGPNTPPGTPPGIGVMVKTESADALAARVTELGGRSMPAFDIGPQGRMAVCFDPNGANFDVWEPKGSPGTTVDTSVHGAPSWFETMTTDMPRATAFYTKLFGWTTEVMPMPGSEYIIFKLGEESIAGGFAITPEMGAMPPVWLVYFTVTDLTAAEQKAVALGAKVCMPRTSAKGVGHFMTFASPQGVMFYLIEYDRNV